MKKMYEVNAKCGHVGRGKYVNISFPVVASDGKSASKIVRFMGRVKHDWKDAINYVREITAEEYASLVAINQEDLYLQCRNVQMQREIEGFKERIHIRESVCYAESERSVEYILKKYKLQDKDTLDELDEYLNCVC